MAESLGSLREELEAGLREALPGLAIVDRDLVLEGPFDADIVGVERGGRLVLVLLVAESEGEEAVLAALDTLAWARANADLVARHLDDRRLRAELDPLVVLVSDGFDERAVRRLAPLVPHAVRLMEVRHLRSSGALTTFLRPVGAQPGAAGEDVEQFLSILDGELRELAALVVQRLERVDEDVRCTPGEGGIEWSLRGESLCTLVEVAGRLEGAVSAAGAPFPCASARQVEAFVDAALGRYVDLIVGIGADEPVLEEVELVPHPAAPLLSPEEIEAFGD